MLAWENFVIQNEKMNKIRLDTFDSVSELEKEFV